MHPILQIGGAALPAYAIFALLGALAAAALVWLPLSRRGLTPGKRLALLLSMCVAFLLGARLWNRAVNPYIYVGEFHWYSLKLKGLSLYGGVLGALLALALFCRCARKRVLPLLDAFAFPGGIAFCIARIGCFLNGCCAGRATAAWTGVVFPSKAAAHTRLNEMLPLLRGNNPALHPTQLYELAGALVGIALVYLAGKRLCRKDGDRFFLYGAWFSAVRLAVLPFRVLQYVSGVKEAAYPALYVGIIACCIWRLWPTASRRTRGAE